MKQVNGLFKNKQFTRFAGNERKALDSAESTTREQQQSPEDELVTRSWNAAAIRSNTFHRS